MIISKLVIKNYKSFKGIFKLPINEDINIIVGDNESGKSTILEAINLGLTGQLYGRNINYELSPYLFCKDVVDEYLKVLKTNPKAELPEIRIEVYLKVDDELEDYAGYNNLEKVYCPGFYLEIKFNSDFTKYYQEYIKDPNVVKTIPIEYYEGKLYSFAGEHVISRNVPINVTLIDTTNQKTQNGADVYISKIIKDILGPDERADLAINHRKLKETFSDEKSIKDINKKLEDKKGEVSDKKITLSLDISGKTNWETFLTAYLDELPFQNVGKGEQNAVKMKLALEKDSAKKSNIILIEEPENHLSYSNMNMLLNKISEKCIGKQLIIVTHSSFVLNKLGLEKLILLHKNKKFATLASLSNDTQKYFKILPGYDTLRIVLSDNPILVEGPSDELIYQKAYFQRKGKLPIEEGVDVISVKGLSFKRFLEIAKILNKRLTVIRDNDGKTKLEIENSYKDVKGVSEIYFDDIDTSSKTLEPQIVKFNDLKKINKILGKTFATKDEAQDYMIKNKTSWALKFLESDEVIVIPTYIDNAVK